MKTKAAYVRAPWQTEIREVDIADTPPNGWIRLRVDACGVCGTDITAAAETAREWQPFGHELAGTVDALGPGVTNVRKGDRIVLQSSGYCGVCSLCRDGRVDLCNKAPHFWGEPAMGFSEYMMTPATLAVPYDGLSPEAASLAEPAGVAFDMVVGPPWATVSAWSGQVPSVWRAWPWPCIGAPRGWCASGTRTRRRGSRLRKRSGPNPSPLMVRLTRRPAWAKRLTTS